MAKVGIVMGSDSDMPVMSKAADMLEKFGIEYEMKIISAHREPDVFFEYAKTAEEKGFKVIIAGSFGDIHYNNDLNNGILPIVQPREVREKLAALAPTDEVTVDLYQQKIISPVGEFDFEIDADWKHKLLNGLDDIGITLQYQDLIEEYERNRPSYWQE